jgi:hypothetical protein
LVMKTLIMPLLALTPLIAIALLAMWLVYE